MKAQEIMTTEPVCCGPRDPVARPAEIMATTQCGCVPVIDEVGQIVGIITDRDIAIRVVGAHRDPRAACVEDVMSRGVVCCLPDDDLEDIAQHMRSHRVRRIPVVDSDARVIGIIAQADLAIRARRGQFAMDAEDLARTLELVSEPTLAADPPGRPLVAS